MRNVLYLIIILLGTQWGIQATAETNSKGNCPLVKIEAERLPDLNIPRYGYNLFYLNGEPVVIGGHTSGFVLTPTAEYFKDGEWHLIQTVYPHDGGFAIAMKSGIVLIAGGFKDNLGIGQSFEVEKYDPITHRFEGFGCLAHKRASAGAVELDSGHVLITGNWYADDGMEIYDGQSTFTHVKDVSLSRYLPHVFRISGNDALILAGYDYHGERFDTILIDRLHGETFKDSLFDTWHPLHYDISLQSNDSFVGDEASGIYAYLMPVENESGQMAIVEVCDTVFSLLPTTSPIPMQSQWGKIIYYSPIYTDQQRQRGYMVGSDKTGRQYALCIDYAKKPAELTLYHTDVLTDTTATTIPVITDEGNLLLTGFKSFYPNSNFTPSASVWLLRLNSDDQTASAQSKNGWIWTGVILAVLAIFFIGYTWRKRDRLQSSVEPEKPSEVLPPKGDEQLMQRICLLMDEQRLFLRPGLKVSDIAAALGTNSRYVSDCINVVKGIPFAQFINEYRMDYAKQLMREQPDMKISAVATESGFSNDKAMTRYFKEHTGMTPTEWKVNSQY